MDAITRAVVIVGYDCPQYGGFEIEGKFYNQDAPGALEKIKNEDKELYNEVTAIKAGRPFEGFAWFHNDKRATIPLTMREWNWASNEASCKRYKALGYELRYTTDVTYYSREFNLEDFLE